MVSGPTIDEDVVVPLNLQTVAPGQRGWRGRSGTIVAVGLSGFVLMGLLLGRALDRAAPGVPEAAVVPSIAAASSTRPTAGPTPIVEPALTPLPALDIVGGQIPTERRLVYADGLQMLDLATGTLEPTTQPLYDPMWPVGADQLVCACVQTGASGVTPSQPSLRFRRVDVAGVSILRRDIESLDGVVPIPDVTDGYNVTTALSADQTTLYVLSVARIPPSWSVDLLAVDVNTGEIVARTTLGRIPVEVGTQPASPAASSSPSPSRTPNDPTPDGVYAWASGVTAAPDGRHVYAIVQYTTYQGGVWANHNREWMIPVRDGHPGSAVRIKAAVGLRPDDYCVDGPTFVDSTTLVQACAPGGPQAPGTTYYVRRLTTSGVSLGDLPATELTIDDQYASTAIIDPTHRAVFIWDPGGHTIARIGLDDGAVLRTTVPESTLPHGIRQGGPGGFGANPALVESPDGQRLYALGTAPSSGRAGRSTGVWVFDADRLDLLDHWEPLALLQSLAVSADGAFVYAAGAQGLDVDGRDSSWPASITVYDAMTGEIQVVYGAVSQTNWVTFPVWQ